MPGGAGERPTDGLVPGLRPRVQHVHVVSAFEAQDEASGLTRKLAAAAATPATQVPVVLFLQLEGATLHVLECHGCLEQRIQPRQFRPGRGSHTWSRPNGTSAAADSRTPASLSTHTVFIGSSWSAAAAHGQYLDEGRHRPRLCFLGVAPTRDHRVASSLRSGSAGSSQPSHCCIVNGGYCSRPSDGPRVRRLVSRARRSAWARVAPLDPDAGPVQESGRFARRRHGPEQLPQGTLAGRPYRGMAVNHVQLLLLGEGHGRRGSPWGTSAVPDRPVVLAQRPSCAQFGTRRWPT